MSVIYFTDEQVEVSRKNPYVKNVSNKSITYTEEFKVYFHNKRSNGYGSTKIFNDAGFDIMMKWDDYLKFIGLLKSKDIRQ